MATTSAPVSAIFMEKVADWLTQAALSGSTLEDIVRGFCDRIAAAGLPIVRVHLSFAMLHPLYEAVGFTWRPQSGLMIEGYRHDADNTDMFLQSPYYQLLSRDLDYLRRRIPVEGPVEFEIFEDLRKENVTDYLAFMQPFGDQSVQGMLGSWSTDAKDGFSEEMIAALLRIQNHLAVAAKMAVLSKLSNNMLTTYLGGDAGKRVLNGQIRRGDGETIRAALVVGDMRQSTMLAEKEGRQAYIDTLNDFFDAIAAPFNRNGGQILSFLGDGFLAVYPCDRHKDPSRQACQAALSAVRVAQSRLADLNAERRKKGAAPIGYGLGLHVGNVMFGNVGLRDRLTFSAFGSAVNEVVRLQLLTKKYASDVVASHAFAGYCAGDWITLGEEKLRGVRQRVTILQPGPLMAKMQRDDVEADLHRTGLSEAERLILLHRDAVQLDGQKRSQAMMDRFLQ
ncbi:adenylate cyclase [Agrobacterium vitis]|uniref:adenylate/guanylate cyclase domain-containing protein n=1 Tax=Agrobacterium vitis TaxID=373 RepID=UPI0015DAA74E|nr:adenylate/guanylate cyclase domain-containing protein [Agrobacterium vitis]BCH66740.1 adenylate cyclase [Agrobacterium vitis]